MSELDFFLLHAVQDWGAAIRPVMAAFSNAGYGAIYLMVTAFVYWCVSPTHAIRLMVVLLLSSCVNTLLKALIVEPRPYWIRPDVFTGTVSASAGMPSGHAQAATAFWGLMVSFTRRPLWWGVCLLMIVATSVSRVYFGMHFPSQIVAGAVVGLVLLVVFLLVEKRVCRFFLARRMAQQRLLLVAGWVVINALALAIQALVSKDWTVPQEWVTNASALHPNVPLDPLGVSTVVRDTSWLLGLLLGAGALRRFSVRYAGVRQALWRFLPGVAVFAVFWLVTEAFASSLPTGARFWVDALRGVLAGWWVGNLWPRLMQRYPGFDAVAKEA